MTKNHEKRILKAISFVITVLYCAKLATSSPAIESDPEQLTVLRAQVNGLQTKLDHLVIKLEDEAIIRDRFQFLNSELETKVAQLAADNAKQADKLDKLRTDFETKINALISQSTAPVEENRHLISKRHHSDNNKSVKEHDEISMNETMHQHHHRKCDLSSLRLPPTSCRQLAFIGHHLNGIYLIANPDTNKVETVYCDFGNNLSETLYGSVALKRKSVHFSVQRSASRFDLNNVVIPFDIERLNEGGAMNLVTGIFTVPVNGIYHFQFFGLKESNAADLIIFLQVNGVDIGMAYATGLPNYLAINGISASLRLKVGDQVRLYKTSGILHDSYQYTHFSGWLVEQDLSFF